MPLLFSLLLAQVGPMVTPGAAPPLPHETAIEPRRPRLRVRPAMIPVTPQPASPCPQAEDGEAAIAAATLRLTKAAGSEKAIAGECLGVALARQDQWDRAADVFRAARAAADTPAWRARLGAQAGEAALNAGDPAAALQALEAAEPDAAGDPVLTGGIALFRARALVALKRESEAEAPLARARAAMPRDAEVWLLSATLSRRLGKLAEAQAQIEKAAELLPVDPAIGLEAGLIAALGGRDEAARKSWQSVLAAAPDSPQAATARAYIAQLGPGAGAKP